MFALLYSKCCNINIVCSVSTLIFFSHQERSERVCERAAPSLQLHGELMFVKNGTHKESLEQYMKVHEVIRSRKIVDQKIFKNIKNIKLYSGAVGHVESTASQEPQNCGTRQEHAANFEAV